MAFPLLFVGAALVGGGTFFAVDYLAYDGYLTNGIFQSLYAAFTEGGHYLLGKMLDGIPMPEATYQWLIDVADIVGYFFPLDVAVALIGAYIGFISLFIIIKLAIKLIPTVG